MAPQNKLFLTLEKARYFNKTKEDPSPSRKFLFWKSQNLEGVRVGGGGNPNVEGDLLTFGCLMLDDALGYPYIRLFNGNPKSSKSGFSIIPRMYAD